MNKKLYTLFLALTCLITSDLLAQNILRGPYLQSVCQDKISIRWRTSTPTNSKVWYGDAADNLTQTETLSNSTTEHEVFLTGLASNTVYYYAIGNNNGPLAGATVNHYFKTSPLPGTGEPISMWILGDAGRANTAQRSVRDAFYNYNGGAPVDLLLTLGDNAYSDGTDAEFQDSWFENMYEDRLINIPMFQTYGNHDAGSADGADNTGVYFDIFTMPTDGSCGGVPSGNESFYSFNYGDVHIVSLNTWDVPRSATSEMIQWLAADLAANDQNWTIVKFHHPVYDGRYDIDSDSKSLNTEMRESCVPIFDQYGVDLVLMGHSHTYQRSFLIDGHYDKSFTFDPATMAIDMGDGQLDGDGAYQKVDGKGIVYVISGTAGSVNSVDNLYHPVMYHSSLTLGSFIIDINHDQLDAKFLTADGIIDDYFTITKDIVPVQLISITNPLQGFTAPQNAIITTSVAENAEAVSAVSFFINETIIGTDNTFPFTMNWTIPANGPYDIEIVATTNFGNYTDSVHIVVGDQTYPADSDGDGTLDAADLCNGSLEPGTICNDNNSATYNDVITSNCNCEGTPYDCPVLLTDIGTPCDDNNSATYDDLINGNCECAGVPYDCPVYLADIGTPCNDNNNNTFGETLNANCDCVGLPISNVVTITTQLVNGSDDAEEAASGAMDLTSTDLEMVQESSIQTIGLRYAAANIPPGAYILEAYLQFAVDEIDTEPTTLNIRGEMSTNAPTFTNTNLNVTARPRTQTMVSWTVPQWLTVNQAGVSQQSVDVSAIMQEVIAQTGYSANTPFVFIIDGSGKRVALSRDKYLSNGPELIVTYGFSCPDQDADGICDQDDLCPNSPGSIGEPCNDGNPATTNDIYNANCECTGTSFDCPTLMANIGSSCNDNNSGTYNDVIDANCNCIGTAYDCPVQMAAFGSPCNDNNTATYNDILDANCNCVGTSFDCPTLLADIGTPCDDNNNMTTNDLVNASCQCIGTPVTGSVTVSTKVNSSSDDAEEKANGSISLSSTDLELVQESSTQVVGIRFVNTGVPANATIVSAYIQFTVDEAVNQNPTNLVIHGEANSNPSTFVNTTINISSRPKTNASANWQPANWSPVGTSGSDQRTADLTNVVQELVNQSGYNSANAMAFIIEGVGKRVAASYDGSAQNAPELVVTYSSGTVTYDCPQLQLNFGASCNDNNVATINDVVNSNCECVGETVVVYDCPQLELNFGASCNDNNVATINDVVNSNCECVGEAVVVYDCPQLELNFGASCDDNNVATINDVVNSNCECVGEAVVVYDCPQLELNVGASCDDADPLTFNDQVQSDCSCAGNIPTGFACSRINATNNDAEEKTNGSVNLTSSDLELVKSSTVQTIGLRFLDLNIPAGAVISSADIQFTVDETQNVNPCELIIYGELHPNPNPFTTSNGNISNRVKTTTYLSWMPEDWTTVHESGFDQQTVDIAPILQEIVNQLGYTAGSAVVIIIEGSGTRIAESYDGDANRAAELCIEYDNTTTANSANTNNTTTEEETVGKPIHFEKAKLHVYPNPTKDFLTLRFDAHNFSKEATIQIWDTNGRLVHNEKQMINAGQEELRLNGFDLPNGNYTVQLHREPFLKSAKFVVFK